MNLNDWINPKIIENKENLRNEFLKAQFFKHLSCENFLNEKKAKELFEALKDQNYYLEENDLYKFLRTEDFKILPHIENQKNQILTKFRKFLLSEDFIKFLEYLTNSKIKRNIIDLHSLKLLNTHYLLCHDDRVEGRQFAFIFNLSKNWTEKDGGELELFKSNEKKEVLPEIFKSIRPKFNQFNIFKVEKNSYHQINEVLNDKERITIGGWYHE